MAQRCLFALGFTLLLGAPLEGQGLRAKFAELFTFGNCGSPLCLGGEISQLTGHGNHYIPAAENSAATAIGFVTNALATTIANTPIPSTSGGATFEFVNGLPVRTTLSSGPIFAERAETLGQGRLLVGVNTTYTRLESVRGVPMDNLRFNFTHEDQPPASNLGSPSFENDVIEVLTDLNMQILVTTAFMTFGLTDRIDIGVAVPLVRVNMNGSSTATILPFGSGGSPIHVFSGSSADPVLVSVASTNGSATGIGDVTGRVKINVGESNNVAFGLLGEVRLPTGDEENLLGAGEFSIRGMGVVSARFGNFTPHINAGYFYRKADFQNDAFLLTTGFDQLLAPWATFAVDFVSAWQVGSSNLILSEPVVYSTPFPRTVRTTEIPDRRDDIIDGSVGFKLSPSEKVTFIANVLVPMGNGGIQPTATYTAGLQINW